MDSLQLGEVYAIVCRFIRQPDLAICWTIIYVFQLTHDEWNADKKHAMMNERINNGRWNQTVRREEAN